VKELYVFVDESGDFGSYEKHSPFYIVTLVFHDQSVDISNNIIRLNNNLSTSGLPEYTIHAGPLIRRENEYFHLTMLERKRIFNYLYNFARTIDVSYHTIIVEKKQIADGIDLIVKISKQLSSFLNEYMENFMTFDRIVLYYDNGQRELTNILVSVFNTIFSNVIFKKGIPVDYKLFQVADMLCTLELLAVKSKQKMLSKSELTFFTSSKNLCKSYLKAIQFKRFDQKV
jgi:hypothetical protein